MFLQNLYPNDHGRIQEANLCYDLDISTDVISFNFSKIRENRDSTLPIGLTAANTATLVLQDVDELYNRYSSTSKLAQYIAPDNRFKFELGWVNPVSKTVEYVNCGGNMYADSWAYDTGAMTATIALRDWSKYLQEKTYLSGAVYENVSAGRAISEAIKAEGFPARKIKYYDSYLRNIIQAKPLAFWALNEASSLAIEDQGGGFNGTWTAGIGQLTRSAGILPQEKDPYIYRDSRVNTAPTGLLDQTQRYAASINSAAANASITTASNSELSFVTDFGISMTVDPSSTLPSAIGDYQVIFGKGDQYYAKWNYAIILKRMADVAGVKQYQFQGLVDTVGSLVTVSSASWSDVQINATEFFHVVLSRDNAALKLQVNGVLTSAVIATNNKTNGYPVIIGLPPGFPSAAKGYIGKISNVAVWNHALPTVDMYKQWQSANLKSQYIFNYLYYESTTPWDAMLNFATADVGVFFFDEDGYFNYEYSNTFHEPIFAQHTTPQYTLNDSTNIVSGTHNSVVQSNRIIVTVNPQISPIKTSEALWAPPTGESLAVTQITGGGINANVTTINVTDTVDPIWLQAGYFKIDDEIIQYTGTTATSLTGCVRGMFGTDQNIHPANSLVRETRKYDVLYTASPAVNVKFPFLTAVIFDKNADVDKFTSSSFGASIIVSANINNVEGDLVILQGTNPVTSIDNFFEIAGIAVVSTTSTDQAVTEIRDISFNERRHRPKELTLNNVFIQNIDYANKIADFLVTYYGNESEIIDVVTTGIPQLQLGDLVSISSLAQLNIVNQMFWIEGISIDYDGGIVQKITLRDYTEGI